MTANHRETPAPRADTLLDIKDVLPQVLMCKTSWERGVRAGKYPKPVYPSVRRPRWKQSAIDAFIAAL